MTLIKVSFYAGVQNNSNKNNMLLRNEGKLVSDIIDLAFPQLKNISVSCTMVIV
ncbi:MAG: hypothetical protein ACRCUY_05720 [Thermoguttaceae bacterium]